MENKIVPKKKLNTELRLSQTSEIDSLMRESTYKQKRMDEFSSNQELSSIRLLLYDFMIIFYKNLSERLATFTKYACLMIDKRHD